MKPKLEYFLRKATQKVGDVMTGGSLKKALQRNAQAADALDTLVKEILKL